jgi:pyruvate kinase
VDYVALSFVRKAGDVRALKGRIKRAGHGTPVIAKVERPEAVKDIREIVRVSDGIMVARGDLGVEMPPEVVPSLQKRIIRLCNEAGKPVITATQMLDSMIRNPRPTRAEASDVAGAVYDGTDCLMLSGETAEGAYPEASIAMMDSIAREAERHLSAYRYECERITTGPEAIAVSACRTADALKAKALICFTRTGRTALLMSKYRPGAAIIAATPDEGVFRAMRLYYGVVPVMIRLKGDTDKMVREVERAVVAKGLMSKGDRAVVTLGVPVAKDSATNLMMIHTVG